MPHGDMGKTVQNYNRPKVGNPRYVHLEAAPRVGDDDECSWLFAGKPGCIHSVLVAQSAAVTI